MSPFSSREVSIEEISGALRFFDDFGEEVRRGISDWGFPLGVDPNGLVGMMGTNDRYRYV